MLLGYKYNLSDKKDLKGKDCLSYFPSDEEITYELKEAKKYASSWAAFVGMHEDIVLASSEPSLDLRGCDGTSSDHRYNSRTHITHISSSQ